MSSLNRIALIEQNTEKKEEPEAPPLPVIKIEPPQLSIEPDSPEIDYDAVRTEMRLEPLLEDKADRDKDIDYYYLPLQATIRKWPSNNPQITAIYKFDIPFIDKLVNYKCGITKFCFPTEMLINNKLYSGGVAFQIGDPGAKYFYSKYESVEGNGVKGILQSIYNCINKMKEKLLDKLYELRKDTKNFKMLRNVCRYYNLLDEEWFGYKIDEKEIKLYQHKSFSSESKYILVNKEEIYTVCNLHFENILLSLFNINLKFPAHLNYEYLSNVEASHYYEGNFMVTAIPISSLKYEFLFKSIKVIIPNLGIREKIDVGKENCYLHNVTHPCIFEHMLTPADYIRREIIINNTVNPLFMDISKVLPIKQLNFSILLVRETNKKLLRFDQKYTNKNYYIKIELLFKKKKQDKEIIEEKTEPPPKQKPKLIYVPPEQLKLDTL